jgi:hypothetical protein
MRSRWTRTIVTLSLAAFLAVAVGCSDDDDTFVAPDLGSGSLLRVVHASPDAPSVDIYVEGVAAPVITDLEYGETSAYADIGAGTYNIQIREARADASSAPAFETGSLPIPEGVKITAIAAGLLAKAPGSSDAFRVMPFVEDFDAPGAGNAAVRIVHAGADAPTVAIDVGNDANAEIIDFERFEETGEAGVPLPAGEKLQIAIWADNPLARVTVFTTPELPGGAELFVIATGLLSKHPRESDGFGLLAVGPSGTIGLIRQNPVVFALHGSPDAPAVDIYAGATELVDNLSFGELSSAIQVPPGEYTLDFRAFDNGPVVATVNTPVLSAGERYLAVATGFLGEASFAVLPVGDAFSLTGVSPLVRVVHASPDAPTVDVGVVDGGFSAVPAFVGLGFGDASAGAGTLVPAGNLTVGVAATGTTTPVATFDIATAADVRAFAVASGSLAGTGEAFRLIIVNTAVYPWTAAQVLPN